MWCLSSVPLPASHYPTSGRLGTLDVRSAPTGAEIYVDGRAIGFTDGFFAIRPGSHKIELRSGGKTKVFNGGATAKFPAEFATTLAELFAAKRSERKTAQRGLSFIAPHLIPLFELLASVFVTDN
jgi:hypothetical protein